MPSARPSPTPPTPSPPSSTPPPPDARTTPALWCPALMVVSLELSLPPLLQLLSPLLRRRGRRGRPPLRLRPILRLRLRPGCSTGPTATGRRLRSPCLQLRSLRLRRPLRLLRPWPPLRLLRQEEEGGDRRG